MATYGPNGKKVLTSYKLPTFTMEVNSALKRQKLLTSGQKRSFIDTLYYDMIQYTNYPSKSFYNLVSKAIVEAYPHLSDKSEDRHATWKRTLINKFKNQRRRSRESMQESGSRKEDSDVDAVLNAVAKSDESECIENDKESSTASCEVWAANDSRDKFVETAHQSDADKKNNCRIEEITLAQFIDTYPNVHLEKEILGTSNGLSESNGDDNAGTRTCLLIIGERRKKLTFQGKKIIDVKREVARKEEFNNLVNVNIDIFQIYDADFEEYIDASDDTTVCDKCKIKVVHDQTMATCQNNATYLVQPSQSDLIPLCIYESASSTGCEDNGFAEKLLPMPNERRIPDEYNIPSFPFDVANTLNNGRTLSQKQRNIIVDALYQDMLQYTIYPPRSFYETVTNSLISKYPYLQDALGVPCMSWKMALINKFKNTRRKLVVEAVLKQKKKYGSKRKHSAEEIPERVTRAVAAGYTQNDADDDEDNKAAHQKWMSAEFKKSNRNSEEISSRMEATFIDRTNCIRNMSVEEVVNNYPCIQLENEFLQDFERLTSRNAYERIMDSFSRFFKPVSEKGRKKCGEEFKMRIIHAIATKTTEEDENCIKCIAAFMYIVRLLREDAKYIFHTDKKLGPPPFLTPTLVLQYEDIFNPGIINLYVNGIKILSPKDFMMGVTCLFAAYWIFNIKYHRKIASTMNFIEHLCCQIAGTVPKLKVINMANWLLKS